MANEQFSASTYRKRKAERREKQTPEWVTNPETGEKFYLRKVSAMAYAVAGAMPHNLTNDAIAKWKEDGLEIPEGEQGPITPKALEEGQKNVSLMAKVVSEACVIPKLVPGATNDDELDPADMEDSDLMCIFKYATGQMGSVNVRGGQVMNVTDIKSLSKQPGRRIRTGTGG